MLFAARIIDLIWNDEVRCKWWTVGVHWDATHKTQTLFPQSESSSVRGHVRINSPSVHISMQDRHFTIARNNPEQLTTSTVVILTDKNKHVTLASSLPHFTQTEWKLHDCGLHCDAVTSFDSQIITPTLLFVPSHPSAALSLYSLSDGDDDDDDVLRSRSHIKWKPNLVSPFQLTHVFTLEVTWLMRKPQDPRLYDGKPNPSLHTRETFYGKRTIFVVTAPVCAATSAAAFIQLKWASASLYK